ncbi:hypothetical protein VTN31DRAFT_1446 [Thermomyces dupontii]|uniref:uncharacterized protein n=1 Tax=Talaromyces thermophilus TaxID=28565 RepID=UPI00374426CD
MDVITEATTVDFIASSYSFPQVVTEELPPSCASPRYSASIVIEFFSPQNFEISKSSYCSMDKCIPKSRNLESTDGTTTRDVTGLKSLNKPPNLSSADHRSDHKKQPIIEGIIVEVCGW